MLAIIIMEKCMLIFPPLLEKGSSSCGHDDGLFQGRFNRMILRCDPYLQ